MKIFTAAALATVSLAVATPSAAAVLFNSGGIKLEDGGGSYITGLDAVHAIGPQSGQTVFGTAVTPGDVTFESDSTLSTTGGGVARFNGPFDDLSFFLTNLGTFDAANFNLNVADVSRNNPITVDIRAFTDGGPVGGILIGNDLSLTNGQNKFGLQGTGVDFTSVSFEFSRNAVDIRQVELGGITAVPEPATWALMIIGFGGAGAMIRRRRSVAVAAV